MQKKVQIIQSNYIPWKGYFDSIQLVDEVILYDDVQYTKEDWRNRNQIKTPQGLKWLSIPVQKGLKPIKDTKIADKKWNKSHWGSILQNYKAAKKFKVYKEFLQELYLGCSETYLSEINYKFISNICSILNIDTKISFSMDFDLVEGQTQRLVDLCKKVNATDYYTGPAAKNYMDESLFLEENISVHYFDYSGYPEYEQLHGEFTHAVTIIDLMLNEGEESRKFMKY